MKIKEMYAFVKGLDIGNFFSVVEIYKDGVVVVHLPSLESEFIDIESIEALLGAQLIEKVDTLPEEVFAYIEKQNEINRKKVSIER